jgi:hypothetical protein
MNIDTLRIHVETFMNDKYRHGTMDIALFLAAAIAEFIYVDEHLYRQIILTIYEEKRGYSDLNSIRETEINPYVPAMVEKFHELNSSYYTLNYGFHARTPIAKILEKSAGTHRYHVTDNANVLRRDGYLPDIAILRKRLTRSIDNMDTKLAVLLRWINETLPTLGWFSRNHAEYRNDPNWINPPTDPLPAILDDDLYDLMIRLWSYNMIFTTPDGIVRPTPIGQQVLIEFF